LTKFNNIWWACSGGKLQQKVIFLSLNNKTYASILCTIKHKSLLRSMQLRHTTHGERRRPNTAKYPNIS